MDQRIIVVIISCHIDWLLHAIATTFMDFDSFSLVTILLGIVAGTIVTVPLIATAFSRTSIATVAESIAAALVASEITAFHLFNL